MRPLFTLLLLIVCTTVAGQQYSQFDTITDPSVALQKLQAAVAKDAVNPELFNRMAQQKIALQEYEAALSYCNKSIGLLAKNKNDKLLVNALYLKGRAQYMLDDKAKAEENWKEGLQLALQEGDYNGTISIASNLGAIYLDLGYLKGNKANFKAADSVFSIAYHEIMRKDSLVTNNGLRTLRLMATSLHFQKKYDSANFYYKKVIDLARSKFPTPYLGGLSFYAKSLSETGNHELAIAEIKEAADYVAVNEVDSKSKTHIMHVYAEVLSVAGNYKDAYKLIDSSYKLLATDYAKINAQAYSESESKFKNAILQYQVQLEHQKKTRLYYLFAGLLLLTALIALWLYTRVKKRMAQEKARQKQIAIDAFIEGEEKEKARIGRELHDGIAQEIVAVKLAMDRPGIDRRMIDDLTRISLDLRNISHELMPQTLKQYGLKLAIEDICQKILAPSGIHYEVESTLADERMANKIEITLYRIFQELVHNIIKHSEATEVLVQLRKMSKHILMTVEDNGKGMQQTKGEGIGISNLKSRVQLVNGNLQYDSSVNEGTTAIVRIPV